MYICMFIHLYAYIYKYTYIYILYVCIHVYIYIRIHTFSDIFVRRSTLDIIPGPRSSAVYKTWGWSISNRNMCLKNMNWTLILRKFRTEINYDKVAYINPGDFISLTSPLVAFKSFLKRVPSAAHETMIFSDMGEKLTQNMLLLWLVGIVCFKITLPTLCLKFQILTVLSSLPVISLEPSRDHFILQSVNSNGLS